MNSSIEDLRKKYGDWALVTGASSGIGLSIARKLASQGVNLCLVALDDEFFSSALSGLRTAFPNIEIRKVAVNLATHPELYTEAIKEATQDVPVGIVFNNAGFLKLGYFDELPCSTHIANVECNSMAALRITHIMYDRMVVEGRRGCLCFTSSAAWFMPAPFAAMYGASKAFMSNFGTSLAIEAKNHGVDVCVVHPSYTHSNLYKDQPKINALKAISKFGWTSDDVADVLFTSVGRVLVRDAGAYSIVTNLVSRVIDAGSLAKLIGPFRHTAGPPPKVRTSK